VSQPDFFNLVQAITGRVTDLVAALVDVTRVPSAAGVHAARVASRELAFAEPWSSAILTLFETRQYRGSREDSVAFVARRLRISHSECERVIQQIVLAGLLAPRRGKYQVKRTLTVDTRDPRRAAELRQHWARAASERLQHPGPRDLFAYNVFAVRIADFERIRELLKQSFRQARSLVAASEQPEISGLLTLGLSQF